MNYNYSLMEHNKDILWNAAPDAIYNIDDQGKLSVISDWNVFGRLWKWIRDRKGTVSERIHAAVSQTLLAIKNSNEDGRLVYVKKQIKASCFPFRRSPVDESSYPADYLATKVKARFTGVTSIQTFADNLMSPAQKERYPKPRPSIFDNEFPRSLFDEDDQPREAVDQRDRRVLSPADVELLPLPEELNNY